MRIRSAIAVIAATIALTLAPVAAHADTVDPQITAALKALPGGEIIDDHTAYWPDLTMTLTVVNPLLRDAIGGCPNGSNFIILIDTPSGAKPSSTSCSTFSTTVIPGGVVRSIADARSTGSLQARNGTTVVATATAQSWNTVTAATDNVKCS